MYKCFNSFQTPSLWLLQSGSALMFFTAIMLTGACKTSTPLQSGSFSDTKCYESVLPRDAEQILLVVKNLTDSLFQGSMLTLERKSGKMVTVFSPIKVSLGKSGIVSGAVKREGDGATPAGFYPLG
jgi:L,D-peptidoglycan transpeptidase YkuD (ErfK/YbiS/YcfS/YnhG family)